MGREEWVNVIMEVEGGGFLKGERGEEEGSGQNIVKSVGIGVGR